MFPGRGPDGASAGLSPSKARGNNVRDLEAIWGTHTGALHARLPLWSIVLSIALTILLNLLIRLF